MSQTRRGGLGRGLAALIPTGPVESPGIGPAAANVVFGSEDTDEPDAASSVGGADEERPSDASAADARPSEDAGAPAENRDTASDGASDSADSANSATGAQAGADGSDGRPASEPQVSATDQTTADDTTAAVGPAAPGGTRGTAAEKAAAAAEGRGGGIGAEYREIPLDQIEPNPKQPRQVFDEEALDELVHSIREFGLLQPVVVRETGPRQFQLIMGERRWRAGQKAGIETIPAIVRDNTDDTLLRDALLENIHRVQLNPLEEASAYQQLLNEFDVTHDELAARIGRSRPVITNTIRLLRLPVAVQRRVAAGVLSAGHARAVLSLEGGPEAQEDLAARVIAEGMSVRATEEAVLLANNGEGPSKPVPRRKPIQMPGLQDVAERLSDNFDTRVTVNMGKKKGKIVVEFGTVDDLERIIGIMDPNRTGQWPNGA